MATYKAGDLSMSIETLSNDTINSLDAVIERLDLINGGLGKMRSRRPKQSTGDNKLFGALKVGSIVASLRRIAKLGSQILQYGVDYTETLNLWQVAMKGNIDAATDFVDKMNEAYGISQKTLMNAQAIFKNMIGSLGQVSEATAYSVSEAITQMAIDYASLYNVSIDSAITKFQAALAGQVRPIRSVAGYDITENTLFQLYQTLGGTKTMRQLSRTEKQLLSIYAVFQQMQASGAVGDMAKTIDQFANQSRMASENAKELATWTGVVLQYTLQQWGVMKYINAALITASEVMKAIAISLGYEMPDFALDWADNVEDTNKAVDELQGKLLDFDKFRALSGTEEDNALGIDTKLLEAIAGYSSNLEKVQNSARKLAETWLEWWIDPSRESGLTVQAEILLETLKFIGIALGVIFAMGIVGGLKKFVVGLAGVTTASKLLNVVLVSGVIWALINAVQAFKDGEYWAFALYTAIAGGAGLIVAIRLLNSVSADTLFNMAQFLNGMKGTFVAVTLLVGGIALFISNLDKLSSTAKVLIPVLSALAGVVAALAIAKAGMTWRAAITAAAITAGIGMVVGTLASVKQYADGGMPDKGTLFVAGEAGAEIVTNSPNGQTGVTNVQQIAQATYQGTMSALRDWWGGTGAKRDIPQLEEASDRAIYQKATAHAKSIGNTWAKV